MAKKPRKKTNEKTAQKINLSPFKFLQGVLISVGKPLYMFLFYTFVGVLFILSLIGRVTKAIFLLPTKAKLPKIKVPRFKISLKIKPPKIKLPKLKVHIRARTVFFWFIVASFVFWFWLSIIKGLPSPSELTQRQIEVSTKIYDRNGVLLYKIYKDKNRTIVPLGEVPMQVRLATLAAEDAEFYDHPGFSIRGILRAVFQNIKGGKLQGGSTITQQLVKNALLTPEKTISRKIKEIILSVQVEITYSKDQILNMYLNEVSYGGTAYGIEEAARVYFAKDVSDLSLAEAAMLTGLPKSPTKFSPFGASPDLAFSRQREVLHLMKINKFITLEQEQLALSSRITFAPNKTEIKAPHFVMYVRQELVDKFGEEMVEKGGLEVSTTLDYSIQQTAEKIVKDEIERLKNLRVGNGAAVVLNPKTGEILAMVGSKDYFNTADDGQVNVTTRLRQPGSSIKVVNYAYALSNGFTTVSVIDDSPITFAVPGTTPYTPKNYDGTYKGKLTLRNAFAQSRNIPAVKVLASYGVGKMIEMGQKMGINTWQDLSRYGLSLTLGGGDVKLIELAQVYATVANYGQRPDIVSISLVKNYEGKILEKDGFSSTNVLDPRVAYILIDILKDNIARAPAFGLFSALVIPNHPEVAVKTGTSNDLKDNLTIGFNQNYLVATWVGNNDSTPMSRIASGITGASPIWNKIMSAILADKPSVAWEVPNGTVSKVCYGRKEYFLQENIATCAPIPKPENQESTPTGGQVLEPAARTEVHN
ncbi:transglycosylase domain-containing protein [Patescibacteria group bacterium]